MDGPTAAKCWTQQLPFASLYHNLHVLLHVQQLYTLPCESILLYDIGSSSPVQHRTSQFPVVFNVSEYMFYCLNKVLYQLLHPACVQNNALGPLAAALTQIHP